MHPNRKFGKTQARTGNAPTPARSSQARLPVVIPTAKPDPAPSLVAIIARYMRARRLEVASCARRPFLHRDVREAGLLARYAAQLTPQKEAAE